jgi:hypothetical protein
MTALDTTLRQAAYDTVQTFGKNYVFHANALGSSGRGTYDPNSGAFTGDTLPVDTAATYAYKASPPKRYVRRFESGLAETTGDVEITLPALNLDAPFLDFLKPSMRVVFDGGDWRTVEIEKLYSGDEICAYNIILTQQSGT